MFVLYSTSKFARDCTFVAMPEIQLVLVCKWTCDTCTEYKMDRIHVYARGAGYSCVTVYKRIAVGDSCPVTSYPHLSSFRFPFVLQDIRRASLTCAARSERWCARAAEKSAEALGSCGGKKRAKTRFMW